jgi:hypothetical protein
MTRAPAAPGGPAAVVLAAGAGRRLAPLTDLRPKALCPVDGRPLLDLALERVAVARARLRAEQGTPATDPSWCAVNAHHLADQLVEHVGDRATVSWERPEPLGTAGALGALHPWLDGRDVLVTNADAWLPAGPVATLLEGWDGERCRLVCRAVAGRGDFTGPDGRGLVYVGAALLPWRLVRGLAARPSGLYEVLWRQEHDRGRLDPVVLPPGVDAVDCGTPADYLYANLAASGGRSVVAPGAVVLGTVERSVVWEGAWVEADEHLVDAVRAGGRTHPLTVTAGARHGEAGRSHPSRGGRGRGLMEP